MMLPFNHNLPIRFGVYAVFAFGVFLVIWAIIGGDMRLKGRGDIQRSETATDTNVQAPDPACLCEQDDSDAVDGKNQAQAAIEIAVPQSMQVRSENEVLGYVLFTRFEMDHLEVVTGIQYRSTVDPVITRQWCYVSELEASGGAIKRLELASIDEAGEFFTTMYGSDALAELGLTSETVKDMSKRCRLQTGG